MTHYNTREKIECSIVRLYGMNTVDLDINI